VQPKHRTGEIVFTHPAIAKPLTVNARRHDATRKLTTFLRRLPRDAAKRTYAPLPHLPFIENPTLEPTPRTMPATPLRSPQDSITIPQESEDHAMAAKKSTAKKAPQRKSRLLSEPKVLRIVAAMGADPEDFKARYGMGGRARVASDEMVAAVIEWRKTKDWKALMLALGTTNRQTASSAISRVLEMEPG